MPFSHTNRNQFRISFKDFAVEISREGVSEFERSAEGVQPPVTKAGKGSSHTLITVSGEVDVENSDTETGEGDLPWEEWRADEEARVAAQGSVPTLAQFLAGALTQFLQSWTEQTKRGSGCGGMPPPDHSDGTTDPLGTSAEDGTEDAA